MGQEPLQGLEDNVTGCSEIEFPCCAAVQPLMSSATARGMTLVTHLNPG